MTAAFGGELATEWVTLLPETATLARKLREFKPAPIKVQVEADYDQVEREAQRSGKQAGRNVDTGVKRETRFTGSAAANNIASGLRDDHSVGVAAHKVGRRIREDIEYETRKISFAHVGRGLLGVGMAIKDTGSGIMAIIRNVGAMATVIRYASKAARGLSLSLLAGATATRLLTGAGISRLGIALGFSAKQADRLATQVARVTSALLVAAGIAKFLVFMNKAAKLMGLVTIGSVALVSAASGLVTMLVGPLKSALILLGSALGIAAGAAAGLLGPMIAVAKIGFKGMAEGAKVIQKEWKDVDEAFYKTIGERMRPMLEAWHNLSNGITDSMTQAMIPTFGNLGTLMDRLAPKSKILAGTFGDLSNEVTRGLLAPSTQTALDKMFDASNRFFRSFLGESGLTGATTGLIQFAATAADTFAGTGKGINDLLLRFGNFLRGVSAAQMQAVFGTIKQQITNIWNVLKPILAAFKELGSIAAPTLGPAFKSIGDAIAQATPDIMKMARIIMPALSQAIQNLAPIIPSLVQAFLPMSRILAVLLPPLASLIEYMAPLAPIILLVSTAIKVSTIALALYNTTMLLVANAQKIATAATWLWNAALAANPIGLVVVAIAALAAALFVFFTKTETGRKLWDKIWTGMKVAVQAVWNNVLKPFFNWFATSAWPVILVGAQKAWTVLKFAFEAIKQGAQGLWNTLKTVFNFIKGAWEVLWFAVQVGWKIGEMVFNAVGDVLSAVWNGVLSPIFDQLKAVWDFLVQKLQWFGDTWTTVWTGLKAAVQVVWDFLKPVRDWIGDFFDSIGALGSKAASAIKSAWSGLANVLKEPLHALGAFLQGIPTSVFGFEIPFVGELKGWGNSLAGLKGGGVIQGPGTGTSDSIVGMNGAGVPIVRVSNGEGIVPANRLDTPMGQALFGMLMKLPAFASGGRIGQFMSQADNAAYQMGGFSMGAFDCSGLVSAMVNVSMGRAWNEGPPGGSARMATASEAAWLKSQGFQKGAGGSNVLRVGFKNGGAGGGHTAGTLPDGTNFESTSGGVRFGSQATGAAGFPEQWYLPRNGPEDPAGGGIPASAMGASAGAFSSSGIYGGGGGSLGGASSTSSGGTGSIVVDPKKVSAAQDKVTDLTNSLDIKQKKLDEYLRKQAAGEKVSDTTIEAARDAVAKQSRELEQAQGALEEAKQGTYKEGKQSKSSPTDSNSDWSSVGGMIFSGFLESFGLDGSVFTNLFDTPNVKSAMAGLNFGLGLLSPKSKEDQSGNGGGLSIFPGSDGGGGGGFLGAGAEMLAGIGEQAGVNIAPHGDMALAGATPGPGNSPTFDLRGSQLGVSPAAFQDKMGEMTASSRRHPTLGPV